MTVLLKFWREGVILLLAAVATYYHIRLDRAVASHTAYVVARDLSEAKALQAATDAADAAYAAKQADYQKVLNDYNAAKTAADARADAADARMRDYQAQLHRVATKGPATPTGDPGPEVVRFRLADYSRFADTALDVAKNAEADADSLQACRAALGE